MKNNTLRRNLATVIGIILVFFCTLSHADDLIGELFRDNHDGTITDVRTNLIWMRCSMGQEWNGQICEGEAKQVNWANANASALNSSFLGKTDWRLPTFSELNGLVYCSMNENKYPFVGRNDDESEDTCVGFSDSFVPSDLQIPTINQQAFPNSGSWFYWSNTIVGTAKDTRYYGIVGFFGGVAYNFADAKDIDNSSARFVRKAIP